MGLDEYTVEGEAIRRFSSPLEQIDWMLASLERRRITFERAREIAQAEFDLAENEADLDPAVVPRVVQIIPGPCAADHQRHELSRGDLSMPIERKRPPALKHGAYSEAALLPGEDPAEFKALHEGLIADFKPNGRMEEETVLSIARLTWRRRNLARFEAGQLSQRLGDCKKSDCRAK
jgi:hypothetical protein